MRCMRGTRSRPGRSRIGRESKCNFVKCRQTHPERIMTPLQSLVASGTKLWLDSVDPDEIARNRGFGATGATSNPIIISDLLATGRFDGDIRSYFQQGHDDE